MCGTAALWTQKINTLCDKETFAATDSVLYNISLMSGHALDLSDANSWIPILYPYVELQRCRSADTFSRFAIRLKSKDYASHFSNSIGCKTLEDFKEKIRQLRSLKFKRFKFPSTCDVAPLITDFISDVDFGSLP